MKKSFFIIAFLVGIAAYTRAQTLYFPPMLGNSWDTLSAGSLGWCTDKVDTLYDYLAANNSKAFILLKDGKIVFEKYFGNFTVDSVWYWASAGKTLTAFLVGIAQQENLLSIEDTTSNYLGNGWTIAPIPKERSITIKNQLTMTTGLDDGVPDNSCTIDTCLQYLANANTRWAYHNAPYTLLDSVIESASGTNLNNYFQQKIKPLTGINGLYVPSGFNNVFYSKPRSMARFGLLMLAKGNWNGVPVMTDTTYYQAMIQTSQALNLSYGYLWWLNGKSSFMVPGSQLVIPGPLCPSAPVDMYAGLGKNGQVVNIAPSQNIVWIRMGDAPGAGIVPIQMNDTIWQKLNAIMCAPNEVTNQSIQTDNLKIYPNPAQGILNIVGTSGIYTFEIRNLLGELLWQEKEIRGIKKLDVSAFPNGVYVLNLLTTSGRKAYKVHIAN
ncbi:MAG: serine hydrolase [Bacteroidetes bacterium]|nr:serine hydrolase [Bacteroidota bacterium]